MWPAIIGAGASLLGGLLANRGREEATGKANYMSAHMAANRHQLEVADLKKAGLNPILSAHGGGPPVSGQSWQVNDVLSPAVASALDAERTRAETNLKDTEADIKRPKAEIMGRVGEGIEQVLSGGISSAVSAAVTSALASVGEPEVKSLPAKAKSLIERISPFEPHTRARDLRTSWDWSDVWRYMQRRYLGNSAKSQDNFDEARRRYYEAYPDPKSRNSRNLMEWYQRNYP